MTPEFKKRILTLLETVKDQRLEHGCAAEGYYPALGCDECIVNTEKELDAVIVELRKEIEPDPKLRERWGLMGPIPPLKPGQIECDAGDFDP